MIFKNHLTKEGEIKSIVLNKTEIVVTTYKKEVITFKRAGDTPALTPKRFEDKRTVPTDRRT